MRSLALLAAVAGCTTMTVRTGVVVIGGEPTFQASAQFGLSRAARRVGTSATQEMGIESGAHTQAFVAYNVDVHQHDPDRGEIARVGVRLRAGFSDATGAALLVHGAVFPGVFGDAKTRSGGLGIELAGGIAFDPQQPAFEANLLLAQRWNLF